MIVLLIWLGRKLTAANLQAEFNTGICLLEKVQGLFFFLVALVLEPGGRKTGIDSKGGNNVLKCISASGTTAEDN